MDAHLEDIIRIRSEVERLQLDGWEFVISVPFDSLLKFYNGTGPEFLPQKIRDLLDGACRPFLPAVMIHDVDFTFSDGSEESFKQANRRLLFNCIRCAMSAHPWTSWKRYALILQAWAMYRAVSHPKFGWVAWIQAANKRKEKPNE